jgi:hypothetical protein
MSPWFGLHKRGPKQDVCENSNIGVSVRLTHDFQRKRIFYFVISYLLGFCSHKQINHRSFVCITLVCVVVKYYYSTYAESQGWVATERCCRLWGHKRRRGESAHIPVATRVQVSSFQILHHWNLKNDYLANTIPKGCVGTNPGGGRWERKIPVDSVKFASRSWNTAVHSFARTQRWVV